MADVDFFVVTVRQVLCLDGRRKYLLILSSRIGNSIQEITKEILIECEPDDLVKEIAKEKYSYETQIQEVLDNQERGGRW